MNCNEFRANINCYLDGDLDEKTTAAFEIHFTSCSKCHLELRSFDKCSRILRKLLKDESPPHTIQEKVFRELDQEK